MTPQDITALIDRHLAGWLGSDADTPTLRDRIAAMIAEAEAGRDKAWEDGNAVYKHEYANAVGACAFMQDTQEQAGLFKYGLRLGQRTTVEGVAALRKQRDALREQLVGERETNRILQQSASTAADNARAERAYSDERDALLTERSKECVTLRSQLNERDELIAKTLAARTEKCLTDLTAMTQERDDAEAQAERERNQRQLEVGAQEYRGNTVSYIYDKAKCYGDIVHGCSPALAAAGFPVDTFAADGNVGAIARAVKALADHAAALAQSRDDAVAAAHLAHEANEDAARINFIQDELLDVVECDLKWYICGLSTGPTDYYDTPREAIDAVRKAHEEGKS